VHKGSKLSKHEGKFFVLKPAEQYLAPGVVFRYSRPSTAFKGESKFDDIDDERHFPLSLIFSDAEVISRFDSFGGTRLERIIYGLDKPKKED